MSTYGFTYHFVITAGMISLTVITGIFFKPIPANYEDWDSKELSTSNAPMYSLKFRGNVSTWKGYIYVR